MYSTIKYTHSIYLPVGKIGIDGSIFRPNQTREQVYGVRSASEVSFFGLFQWQTTATQQMH